MLVYNVRCYTLVVLSLVVQTDAHPAPPPRPSLTHDVGKKMSSAGIACNERRGGEKKSC